MKVFVTPASTKTGAAVVRSLLTFTDRNVEITALYRDLKKVPDEFTSHDNFKAVQADVGDASSLDFSNADAVVAITPPIFDGSDIGKHAENVSNNVKSAIEKAGSVKRLVLLSSMGAQFDHGVGEIRTNHIAERVFSKTNVPEIVFVRCAYFMENWNMSLGTLKAPEPFFFTTITPVDWKIAMIAIQDIGLTLAREVVSERTPPAKPHIFELQGPEPYSPLDVQRIFSLALGTDVEIKPVEKDELPEFFGKIFPPSTIDDWVEMAKSFIPGGIAARDVTKQNEENIVHGTTTLAEVLTLSVAPLKMA